jgi:transcriptional regulator with PAS, ATPase and Fis domain
MNSIFEEKKIGDNMKKLAIISMQKSTCDFYKKELEKIFKGIINIDGYYLENGKSDTKIDADLVLITAHAYFNLVKSFVNDGVEIIIMRRTFTKEGLEKLKKIPVNTTAMLVNVTLELAFETISQIYQLGIRHINFIPVYPGIKQVPQIDTAVTPGESRHVPKSVKKIIDISGRKLDISTIMDIVVKLGLSREKTRPIIDDYMKKIVPLSYEFEDVWNKSKELNNLLEIIANMYNEALIAVNHRNKIIKFNHTAQKVFKLEKNNVIGENIDNILPQLCVKNTLISEQIQENLLVKINNKDYVVNNYPVSHQGRLLGAVSICNEFYDIEDSYQRLKMKFRQNGYVAKYTFDNIIGNSNIINSNKEMAKKMACSDHSVIIYGQSGTGKELFAQAIHNCSKRKNAPFIAINCSAITHNLLESELFGYEEGAFTGAKKGGSKGLFELAHTGTIFLDEIGEISLSLQAKLLRVLQEKEIRRVGGKRVINVDVRVIAATNKNLMELINKNKFREDLYYRLAVFPLYLPSLKERKEDLDLLIDSILKEKRCNKKISDDVMKKLINYEWPGNIRQLQNCMEYCIHMSEEEITIDDLPREIKNDTHNEITKFGESSKIILNNIELEDDLNFVLKCIYDAYKNKQCIGRRTILKEVEKDNKFISEQMIRNALKQLEDMGFVKIMRGRMGTRLTPKGIEMAKGLNG